MEICREVLKQGIESKIEEARYNEKYKWISFKGVAEYFNRKGDR